MKNNNTKVLNLDKNKDCLMAIGGSLGLLTRLNDMGISNKLISNSLSTCIRLCINIVQCIKKGNKFDLNAFVSEMKVLRKHILETENIYITENEAINKEIVNSTRGNMTNFIKIMSDAT